MIFFPELPKIGYVIYREGKGFSKGGTSPVAWSVKKGKIWSSLGALKNHLSMDLEYYAYERGKAATRIAWPEYQDAVIFEISSKEVVSTVSEMLSQMITKRTEEFKKRELKFLQREREEIDVRLKEINE